jgi:uncharacterized protein with FMN-binding domain
MKRALLIAGGTVGGLGAVLAITPPQLTSANTVGSLSGSLGGGLASGTATKPAATPAATKAAPTSQATPKTSTKPTSKATSGATASSSATASAPATQSATPTASATPTKAAPPAPSGYSGTINGGSFQARNYGTLSATVTFKDGKITNVNASQSPTSWSQQSLSSLIPYASSGKITVDQIKQYAAEQLPCAISNSCRSQASFSATAFWQSVKAAISKAGL